MSTPPTLGIPPTLGGGQGGGTSSAEYTRAKSVFNRIGGGDRRKNVST
jgi:hypothetical protein